MIETYLLHGLAEIDRRGSITRAAESLHLSQPALSRAMQKLEGELGASLFDRTAGKTSLNQTGIVAAEHARHVLAALDGFAAAVRAADRARRIFRYGAIAPAPTWYLQPILERHCGGRKIEVDVRDNEDDLMAGLADGSYEMAVMLRAPQDPGWYVRPFLTERLGVLLQESHRLARRKRLSFVDLAGETFVLFWHIGFWMPLCRKLIPNARFIGQDSLEALQTIIENAALPAFYSDISLKFSPKPEGKVAVPLSDPEASATFHIVCRADRAEALEAVMAEAGQIRAK